MSSDDPAKTLRDLRRLADEAMAKSEKLNAMLGELNQLISLLPQTGRTSDE